MVARVQFIVSTRVEVNRGSKLPSLNRANCLHACGGEPLWTNGEMNVVTLPIQHFDAAFVYGFGEQTLEESRLFFGEQSLDGGHRAAGSFFACFDEFGGFG